MSETLFRIGDLAVQTGASAPTIRYYESVGLLPRATRQRGGQRRYGAEDVRRLTFIRRCRDFGFSMEQVRELVDLVNDPSRDCTDVLEIAELHLAAVRARLAELQALERDIVAFARRCADTCAGGPGPSCVPLAQLAFADAPEREAAAPGRRRSRPAARVQHHPTGGRGR